MVLMLMLFPIWMLQLWQQLVVEKFSDYQQDHWNHDSHYLEDYLLEQRNGGHNYDIVD
jgi:hypothetical protein